MLMCIPDVHGRQFWKEAIEKYMDKVDRVIILGDYLDPYPWEGITRKDAIRNFQEIIEFKQNHKDKVILLIGNHDLPYINKRNFWSRCRYDSSNAYHIEKMFKSHISLFQLVHEEEVNGKKWLFSHAGLLYEWFERNQKIINNLTIDSLNKLLSIPSGIRILSEPSKTRGGIFRHGSIVWNDVTDFYEGVNDKLPWDYQVVGHSQQDEHPIITKEFACLDCRKAFIITDEGGFQEI